MLLQSLLLIATLAVIGSAILTSTLASAKSAFHSAIMRQSESAMNDATALFVSWVQNNIRQNGINQLPVWAALPVHHVTQPACNESLANQSDKGSSDCDLYRITDWRVTGYSDPTTAIKSSNVASKAKNLSTAQDEQRISVTVTVALANLKNSITYSRQSREITARLFHDSPYIAVTAERDAKSEVGSIVSTEGDTAGFKRQIKFGLSTDLSPTSNEPASYTRTDILTTVGCVNTSANASTNPQLDDSNINFAQLRPYGNIAWSYEVPCKSAVKIDPATAPTGYTAPSDNVYGSTSSVDLDWDKHDDNNSSFAH